NGMLPPDILDRGEILWRGRRGQTEIRPLPRMAVGAALIEPELCESRHEVMALAREANAGARMLAGSAIYVRPRDAADLAAD
ncbi:MAG: hypothetical protein JNN20_20230, partial [Betaproteobacteria bacterium]|nr:hypothetical protein [Betaproteobacteria bacterium]